MGYEFIVYRDRAAEWRWQFRAIGNSEPIAVSSEGYKRKPDCMYALGLVKKFAATARVREL